MSNIRAIRRKPAYSAVRKAFQFRHKPTHNSQNNYTLAFAI